MSPSSGSCAVRSINTNSERRVSVAEERCDHKVGHRDSASKLADLSERSEYLSTISLRCERNPVVVTLATTNFEVVARKLATSRLGSGPDENNIACLSLNAESGYTRRTGNSDASINPAGNSTGVFSLNLIAESRGGETSLDLSGVRVLSVVVDEVLGSLSIVYSDSVCNILRSSGPVKVNRVTVLLSNKVSDTSGAGRESSRLH